MRGRPVGHRRPGDAQTSGLPCVVDWTVHRHQLDLPPVYRRTRPERPAGADARPSAWACDQRPGCRELRLLPRRVDADHEPVPTWMTRDDGLDIMRPPGPRMVEGLWLLTGGGPCTQANDHADAVVRQRSRRAHEASSARSTSAGLESRRAPRHRRRDGRLAPRRRRPSADNDGAVSRASSSGDAASRARLGPAGSPAGRLTRHRTTRTEQPGAEPPSATIRPPWGYSSAGRAPAWHAGGPGFESP